jgi:hypothetical protein
MKRDMELVRELLLKIADAEKPPNFSALVAGRKENTPEYKFAAYHMKMLINEVQLVRGIDCCAIGGDEWLRWPRLFGQIFRFDKWIVCRG